MATLGLRSTGNFASDERPKNWREGIMRLYPNGGAALTAFLALLDSEPTDDPEYSWWEKGLPKRNAYINNGAGYTAGATTFTIDDNGTALGSPVFRAGDVIIAVRTNEHMRVTADSTTTQVQVERGFGETAAAALVDDDELRVIGNVNEEGASCPTSLNYDPTKKFNYTQIWRAPLEITRTAKKTRLRSEDAYRKAKVDALEKISLDMEESLIWGERLEQTGPGGHPIRTTRGVVRTIEADAPGNDFTATSSTLNETELLSYLETIFRFGSTEKLALCGSTALNVLTQIAKDGSQINVDSGTEFVGGVRLKRYISAFGDLMVRQHPLFNRFDNWRKVILILDLANLRYRYIDDLMFLRDRQDPCDDKRKDEFLAEAGLEVHHGETHGIIRDVATFGA